jgi:CPA2 family monovalent cation:H+ antiporter-2
MPQPPASDEARVIVAGFGRVGTLVASMLEEQKIAYLAVDMDVANVTRAHKDGKPVYYGDATNPAFLAACGISTAKALAITMDNPSKIDEILRTARNARPDLKIIARARDERHAIKLYEAGVTEAVPETIEASLQLAEA